MRASRVALGALAGLGLVLPLAVPASADPSITDAVSPGVTASAGTDDDAARETRDPQDREQVLEDEAGPGADAGALSWLTRTLEELALALRARAGLPTTEPMPQQASGDLETISRSPDPPIIEDGGVDVMTVRVQVERGLTVDGPAFARFVMKVLNDDRGWGHDGSVRFVGVDGETADFSVVLASPQLTDELCVPLETAGKYSCGRNGRAVLNAVRWSEGAEPFLNGGGNITEYRQYLVSHEVGHLLGNPHVDCPAPGEPAPIMVQQTITLDGCEPNAWPATTR
ncbi:DUF3152 domain-containing protein [Georgenia halophila]|uniref:DUF3152 domain-containing protein n=1 Tax=Georgenia halophila TaxID=620889 RepID=UPI0031EBEEFE